MTAQNKIAEMHVNLDFDSDENEKEDEQEDKTPVNQIYQEKDNFKRKLYVVRIEHKNSL